MNLQDSGIPEVEVLLKDEGAEKRNRQNKAYGSSNRDAENQEENDNGRNIFHIMVGKCKDGQISDEIRQLKVAIKKPDLETCKGILANMARVDDHILLYAIDQNNIEAVELILDHNQLLTDTLPKFSENYPQLFQERVDSDILLYAIDQNNIKAAKLILDHNQLLTDTLPKFSENYPQLFQGALEEFNENEKDEKQLSWEAFILKQVIYKAICSPEYINAIYKSENKDPFEFCMHLVKLLREDIYDDKDQASFYNTLIDQVEEFMCALLDQIKSNHELNDLFECWTPDNKKKHPDDKKKHPDDKEKDKRNLLESMKIYKTRQADQLSLLEKACDQKLVKFVSHQYSQFILSKLWHPVAPKLRGKNPILTWFARRCCGLLFFFWPFLNLLPQWSWLGNVISCPSVTFECHFMSKLSFIVFLIAYVQTRSTDYDYLGAPPTVLECIICVYVYGMIIGEVQELLRRGIKDYLRDRWNWFDAIKLLLFSMAMLARLIDLIQHFSDPMRVYRNQWAPSEPRFVSVPFLAIAYVFAFMNILSFSRVSSLLGPLRATLLKMLLNVIQFFVIFALLMLTFTVSLTELYWYYGTEKGKIDFCVHKNNHTAGRCPTFDNSIENVCQGPIFTSFISSLKELFWALFGQFDVGCIRRDKLEDDGYIDNIGVTLVGIYHICVTFILLNMLIAMMTKSFDRTNDNKDVEWKYYRTELWIRFIRQDYSGPPPMNIIPDIFNIALKLQKLLCKEEDQDQDNLDEFIKNMQKRLHDARLDTSKNLMERYMMKYCSAQTTQL